MRSTSAKRQVASRLKAVSRRGSEYLLGCNLADFGYSERDTHGRNKSDPLTTDNNSHGRALGDIGNLVGPFNSRCNVGKENAAIKREDAATKQVETSPTTSQEHFNCAFVCLLNAITPVQAKPAGVMTRRSAAAAGVVIDAKVALRAMLIHSEDEDALLET